MVLFNVLTSLLCFCSTFKIKMYFGDNYSWQGRDYEFKEFCWTRNYLGLKSFGVCWYGNRMFGPCLPDAVYITRCKVDDPRQMWTFEDVNGGEFLVKSPGTGTCLERINNNAVRMRICDRSNPTQRFYTSHGSRSSEKFSISQSGKCLGQKHHPKKGEVIEMESCNTLLKDDTLFVERSWL
ncbi:expressed unknown protein [Seminavis robusta]|uniref:Ricin B lectin domain-containing protein n=1 Tax=Seminavis robusta TaxID=568900 RepID=A0A9N8EIN8_9STRA|nr:expressed unknown protein [Seminavis robusta]|eukprot:Sro1293_g260120.1 n/a (181) ;mRNA; r:14082-14624